MRCQSDRGRKTHTKLTEPARLNRTPRRRTLARFYAFRFAPPKNTNPRPIEPPSCGPCPAVPQFTGHREMRWQCGVSSDTRPRCPAISMQPASLFMKTRRGDKGQTNRQTKQKYKEMMSFLPQFASGNLSDQERKGGGPSQGAAGQAIFLPRAAAVKKKTSHYGFALLGLGWVG